LRRFLASLPIAAHLRYVALFCLVFFPVYAAGQWRGGLAAEPLVLALPWERQWPFAPAMLPVYLSLFAAYAAPLFTLDRDQYRTLARQSLAAVIACGAVFLLLPTTGGFPPDALAPPPWQGLHALVRAVDGPYNLFPSLHVAGAGVVLLTSAQAAGGRAAWLLRGWLGLIALSTLFVHQHHIADLAAGLAIAVAARRLFPLRP